MDIENNVKKIIAEIMDVKEKEIDSNYSFIDNDMSSLAFIKLVIMVENMFDFEFDDDDLDIKVLGTCNDLVQYIEKNTR